MFDFPSNPVPGQIYDSGAIVYTYNGAVWNPQGQPILATGTTHPRTAADRFAEPVNVKDFGATGISEDDATDAVTAAIAKAQEDIESGIGGSGGRVYFPDGDYRLTGGAVMMTEGIMLEGASINRTRIFREDDSGPTLCWIAPDKDHVVRGGGMKNLTLYDTNDTMTTLNSPFHVEVDFAEYMNFNNVRIVNGAGGMRFKSLNGSFISDVNLVFTQGGPAGRCGIQFDKTAIPDAYSLTGGDVFMSRCNFQAFNSCLDYCLDVQTIDGLWLSDVHFYGAKMQNMRISRSSSAGTFNIFGSKLMFDLSYGGGLIIDGDYPVFNLDIDARFSVIGTGTRQQDGLAIYNAGHDFIFDVSVEGYKGYGIVVNADIENLIIRPRQIRGNNQDGGGGSGIGVARCKSMLIEGGVIGGGAPGSPPSAGTQEHGILLLAEAKNVTIRGCRIEGNIHSGLTIAAGATGSAQGVEFGPNNGAAVVSAAGSGNFRIRECPGYSPLYATGFWDPPAVAAGQLQTTNIVLAGAELGDMVRVSANADLTPGLNFYGYVANTDTITLVLMNVGLATTDKVSFSYFIEATKR